VSQIEQHAIGYDIVQGCVHPV